MRIAILLHGNLRTFMMPMRNGRGRLCDNFMESIVKPNGADVFAFTDTSNFFYEDTQYYPENRRIEILNNDPFRLHNSVGFMKETEARNTIEDCLGSSLGTSLKSMVVESPYDATSDPKFQFLNEADVKGSSPALLIHQWRKLKLAYGLMAEHEKSSEPYDIVVKWRFDLNVEGVLNIGHYDFNRHDLYVAGIHDPIIYDWHAFGRRPAINTYAFLYDRLGYLLPEGRTFMYECQRCSMRTGVGHDPNAACPRCNNQNIARYEITVAPEYHLFRLLRDSGARIAPSNYPACPYHYKENDSDKRPITEVINGLGLKDVTLVTHTAGKEVGIQKFQ